MNRQEANQLILQKLSLIVENNPDIRFVQILHTLGLDQDLFYQEPEITLQSANWEKFECLRHTS
jgi:hypothetical protein